MSDIASAVELADMLGVRQSAIYEWRTRHASFPEPITVLGEKMLIWSKESVRVWAVQTGRLSPDGKPLRPPRARKLHDD